MNNKKYRITFESKTFIVPLKARSRAICWHDVHKDSESGLGAMFAVVESSNENIRACEVTCDVIKESFKSCYFEDGYYVFDENEKIEEKLKAVFEEVNRSLFSVGSKESVDMRVSLMLGITCHETLYLGHSGESRGLMLRNHRLHQITARKRNFSSCISQDTLSVQKGREKEQQENKRFLLGNRQMPAVDIHKVIMKHDDILLFFTDSVTEKITDNEILSFFLNAEDSLYPLSRIITTATDRGGYRDIMLVGIKFQESRDIKTIDEATTADLGSLGALEDLISAEKDEVVHQISTIEKKPLPKWIIFLFSLLCTVVLGFLYLSHVNEKLQESSILITIKSVVPLKSLLWQGVSAPFNGAAADFQVDSHKNISLLFEPEREQYTCHIIIISKDRPKIVVEPSMVALHKNTVEMSSRKIIIHTNVFTVLDPPKPEYEETEVGGVQRNRVEFLIRSMKGPFEIVSDGRSKVEEVKAEIRNFN